MIPLLLKRLLHGIIVLWIVATLTFLLLRVAPGGPFDSDRKLPPEVIANLEASRGCLRGKFSDADAQPDAEFHGTDAEFLLFV